MNIFGTPAKVKAKEFRGGFRYSKIGRKLSTIPKDMLNRSKRETLFKALDKRKSHGLTKHETEGVIRELMENKSDNITRDKARKLKSYLEDITGYQKLDTAGELAYRYSRVDDTGRIVGRDYAKQIEGQKPLAPVAAMPPSPSLASPPNLPPEEPAPSSRVLAPPAGSHTAAVRPDVLYQSSADQDEVLPDSNIDRARQELPKSELAESIPDPPPSELPESDPPSEPQPPTILEPMISEAPALEPISTSQPATIPEDQDAPVENQGDSMDANRDVSQTAAGFYVKQRTPFTNIPNANNTNSTNANPMTNPSTTPASAGSMADLSRKSFTTISLLVTDRQKSSQPINEVLTEFGHLFWGRFGLPLTHGCTENCASLMILVANASDEEIQSLLTKLSPLEGVIVKTTKLPSMNEPAQNPNDHHGIK